MRATAREANEWVDGFLFIANRTILDFLNTKPELAAGLTELLPDAHALETWLIAAGIVSSPRAKTLVRGWRDSAEAASFVKELTAFRARLRTAVMRIEDGSLPTDAFLAEVNSLLREYPRHTSLNTRDSKLVRETVFEPRKPADLWAPIVDATADLFTEEEPSRIRKCESCVAHFFDTSKKGSRRWCSMNICGNKLKVAAYQRRRRGTSASSVQP
jgi:predicted RNA-binding Zn ribbon-like protein